VYSIKEEKTRVSDARNAILKFDVDAVKHPERRPRLPCSLVCPAPAVSGQKNKRVLAVSCL
jgi:hypothetical protein